jgi:hypothetical protein
MDAPFSIGAAGRMTGVAKKLAVECAALLPEAADSPKF